MLRSYIVFRDFLDEGTVAVGRDASELITSGESIKTILEELDEMVVTGDYDDYDTEAFHLERLRTDLNADIRSLRSLKEELDPFLDQIHEDYSMDDKAEQLRQLISELRFGTHDILNRGVKLRKSWSSRNLQIQSNT